MNQYGFDNLPVVSNENAVLGVVSEGNLTAKLMPGRVLPDDAVEKAMYTQFKKVNPQTKLSDLSRIFDQDHFCLVISPQLCFGADGVKDQRDVIYGVVTRIDLLTFITKMDVTTLDE